MTSWLHSDWVTLCSLIVALTSFIFSIIQTINLVKVKRLNKEFKDLNAGRYAERYATLFGLVETLINRLDNACDIVNKDCVKYKSHGKCGRVPVYVNAAMDSTQQVRAMCLRLNEEHKMLFGYRIVDDLSVRLKLIPCMDETKKRIKEKI
jgi:hypothetical protein